MFEIKDRELRGIRREKDQLLPIAEEIIVTKNEIEELYSSNDGLKQSRAEIDSQSTSMPQQAML